MKVLWIQQWITTPFALMKAVVCELALRQNGASIMLEESHTPQNDVSDV
jgi:hypothetical protein